MPGAWRGLERADLPVCIEPGEGLPGRAVAERRVVSVSYGETTIETVGMAQRRSAMHELHVPILHGDRTVGVISLGRLDDRPFSESDLELVGDLAERAGVEWAQAKATRRLRRTADELGAVLESTDEGVYGINLSGELTVVNRAATE